MIGGRRGGDFLGRKKTALEVRRERFREREGNREEGDSWVRDKVGVVAGGDWRGERWLFSWWG